MPKYEIQDETKHWSEYTDADNMDAAKDWAQEWMQQNNYEERLAGGNPMSRGNITQVYVYELGIDDYGEEERLWDRAHDPHTRAVVTIDPVEYAYEAGAKYARQVMSEPQHHQDGPGTLDRNDDLPEEDYHDLKQKFGNVTTEMARAYKDGYNGELEPLEKDG